MTLNPPDGAGQRLPFLFAGKSTFNYRVEYSLRNIIRSIQYTSVHELILNLYCFKGTDTVTYVLREDGSNYMIIPVGEFKTVISDSIYSVTHDHLERLYLRLLLTNQFSQSIADRGRFKQFDLTLSRYLTTIKGGMDCYLAYENRRVIFYAKYRRLSTNHLLAKIIEWNDQHDIHINHINIPKGIGNQGLFEEVLKLHLRKNQFRIYHYDPISEAENDKIVPTEPTITSAIIQVINQLLN